MGTATVCDRCNQVVIDPSVMKIIDVGVYPRGDADEKTEPEYEIEGAEVCPHCHEVCMNRIKEMKLGPDAVEGGVPIKKSGKRKKKNGTSAEA